VLLVGGKAINLWALYYGKRTKNLAPLVSRDVDVLGDRQTLTDLAKVVGAKPQFFPLKPPSTKSVSSSRMTATAITERDLVDRLELLLTTTTSAKGRKVFTSLRLTPESLFHELKSGTLSKAGAFL
jgi:hypothetical protein